MWAMWKVQGWCWRPSISDRLPRSIPGLGYQAPAVGKVEPEVVDLLSRAMRPADFVASPLLAAMLEYLTDMRDPSGHAHCLGLG